MRKLSQLLKLSLQISLVFMITSCAGSDYGRKVSLQDTVGALSHARMQETNFDVFIGKTKSEITGTFGAPLQIYVSNPPTYILPYGADEWWSYAELSQSDAGEHDLYFKGEELIKVDVGLNKKFYSDK